jgi:uncharacterized phage protein gp47/JayE
MSELYVPTPDDLRNQFLDDLELAAIDAGVENPPIEPGTDWYALATAEANLHAISSQNTRLADESLTPLTATGDKLEEWREGLGIAEVPPQGASGLLIVQTTGNASVVAGEQLTHSSGQRYAILRSYTSVANNDELEAQAVDVGEETNLDPGEVLTWVSPPPNIKSQATVSETAPMRGGAGDEDDERKRERILNTLRNVPAGGNWGYLRDLALGASPATQDAYVYPALGGPASAKLAVTKKFDASIRDFSRTPTDGHLDVVRNAVWGDFPDQNALVVQGVADEPTSVAIDVDIPDSLQSGGDGRGWLDENPWPQLEVSDGGFAAVSAVSNSKKFKVDADTTTAPVAGQTRVARWSPVDQVFTTALITAQTGSSGGWWITVDKPLIDSDNNTVAVGDYISPAATNLNDYGASWRDILESIGPGENTTDANRLPRAARHPLTSAEDSPALNASQTRRLQNAHEEIVDIAYGYRERTAPTVPASVDDAPNVLTIDNLGFYKL